MNYYYLVLRTISDFDNDTKFENFQPINYGLEFSYMPFDDILEKDGKYFCTERLVYSIFIKNKSSNEAFLSGVNIIGGIRVTTNYNWQDLYGNISPENFYEIEIIGQPFQDDLGILEVEIIHEIVGKYKTKFLIGSERAVKILILNHCPFIQGIILNDYYNDIINHKDFIIFDNPKYRLINNIDNIWE